MVAETGKHTGWIKPALVVLIFAAPVVLAYVLYFAFPAAPGERTNQGELLVPARPLPALGLSDPQGEPLFRGQWTLLLVAPQGCGQACHQRLQALRKIRLMLRQDSRRVQQVLVSGDPADKRSVPQKYPAVLVRTDGETLTAFFGRVGTRALGPGVIYLVDPLGNWVLYYPAGRDAMALYKDLQRLLALSGIG